MVVVSTYVTTVMEGLAVDVVKAIGSILTDEHAMLPIPVLETTVVAPRDAIR